MCEGGRKEKGGKGQYVPSRRKSGAFAPVASKTTATFSTVVIAQTSKTNLMEVELVYGVLCSCI